MGIKDSPIHTNLWRVRGTIKYAECSIEHYDNNGGVVLRSSDSDALIWMHVSLIGFSDEDNRVLHHQKDIVLAADEIFRAIIEAHNHAYNYGEKVGRTQQIRHVKEALGI